MLAHELGHFKRHHVIKRIAWTFGMSLLFLWVSWLSDAAALVLPGIRRSCLSRTFHRDGTVVVLPGNACVYVPVSADRQPVFPQARVRGRRICCAQCLCRRILSVHWSNSIRTMPQRLLPIRCIPLFTIPIRPLRMRIARLQDLAGHCQLVSLTDLAHLTYRFLTNQQEC